MTDETKICPSCGAEVLAQAHVCKHCRHRFDEIAGASSESGFAGPLLANQQSSPDAGRPLEPQPGTLTAPAPPTRRATPPVVWIGGSLVAIGIVIAIALGSGSSNSSPASDAPSSDGGGVVITGSEVESKLTDQLTSRTGQAISDVSCPDQDLHDGDTLACDVTFESGRTQGIVVTITGTAGNPHLDIGLQ